jgi:ribosomal protein S27AE
MPILAPEIKRAYHLKYVSKPENRLKLRCRERCAHAIRTGKLVRLACEKCGAEKAQAHHEDYSKPFDVKWLCSKCHAAAHTRHPKPFCKNGHEMTGGNILISRGHGRQWRACRKCHNAAARQAKLLHRRADPIRNGAQPCS